MTQAIDITAEQRRTILALLNRHLPGTTVWAYGSRVKWTSRPESDLDLVAFARPEQSARVADLREAFEESNLPFRVDLFVWDEVPEGFCKQIKSEYEVLVEVDHHDSWQGWRETTLGNVVELKRGYDLPQRERRYGKIPIVSSSGIIDYHFQCKVRGPGVVTGRYGTLGQVFFVPDDFWPLNTTLYVRDFKGNDPRFISYFLKVINFSAYSDKAAVPGLNRNHLHQASVHLPEEIAEQRAIAHILGTLDDKIELNRRMNETLEAMARALFKSWFVDFDPVRAKMEGRDTGLPRAIADLFPDQMIESELGLIPDGWEVLPLSKLIEINPTRSLRKGEVAPYLDMANMPTKGHVPHAVVDRQFGAGMRFTNGDTLVARITPCLENGKTAYVDFLQHGETGWGSTEYIVLRPMSPFPNEFAYYLARSARFREFAIQNMTGTSGRQRAPAAALSKFLFTASPTSVAECFGRFVRPLMIRASEAALESRTLAALRDTLLPKLVSGELRTENAAGLLEGAP